MYKTDKKKTEKKQLFLFFYKTLHQIWNVMQGILGMSIYGYSL